LEGPGEIFVEHALKFEFKTSNNQAEYEAIIVGLYLANELEVTKLICKTDSRLVVGQLTKCKGNFASVVFSFHSKSVNQI